MDPHDPTNNSTSTRQESQLTRFQQRETTPQERFWESNRAQTSIDLVLAIMVFFTAVALVTVQSPGLFFPQGLSASDTTATSDRIALELTNTELSEPGTTELSHDAVVGFLESNPDTVVNVSDEHALQVRLSTEKDGYGPPPALDPNEDNAYSYTVQENGDEYYVVNGDTGSPPEDTTVTIHRTLDDRQISIEVSVWNS